MIDITKIDFEKGSGLVPAVIVDEMTKNVLMLGFMNEEALLKTIEIGKVTFFSRTKNRLWTKGETSGNYLLVEQICSDCDSDSLLVHAVPKGDTCHLHKYSCFDSQNNQSADFLPYLFSLIKSRKLELPENSYTTKLFEDGSDRIIQKVGEESVETVIAAKNRDADEIKNEVADLVFHLFVMLVDQGIELDEIIEVLRGRHQ